MYGADALPAAGWWARGLALTERLPPVPGDAAPPDPVAAQRLAAWRSAYGLAASGQFQVRLDDARLAEGGLLDLLAEPAASLANRVPMAPWACAIEAVRRIPGWPGVPAWSGMPADGWLDAFAQPFSPLIADACDRLARNASSTLSAGQADVPSLVEGFGRSLRLRLARLAMRTLVRELHAARPGLRGGDSRARFDDFVRMLCTPAGLAGLVQAYPVLGRLLAQTCQHALDAYAELLGRYATDREAIVGALCAGDPGPLVAVDNTGDAHRRGRSVAVLRFADGTRAVYKPRPLDVDARFAAFVAVLNRAVSGLGLRTADCILRPGYGWQRFAEAKPCADEAGLARFYRRQGALLALLHAVNGSDITAENVVACGDQPVLVDLETLFHPTLARPTAATDPAARALDASVHRTAMLPTLVAGDGDIADVSGLCGGAYPLEVLDAVYAGTDEMRLVRVRGAGPAVANRPSSGGRPADPITYQDAILDGFGVAYAALAAHRSELLELIDRAADDEIRVVARHTRAYATLLAEALHPDLLRDGLDRDRTFDLLWTMSLGDAVTTRLIRAEIADLWEGDIPVFTSRAGARDLWTSTGERIVGVLPESGVAAARAKVAALGEADRRTQEWVVVATFATRRPAGATAGPPVAHTAGARVDPARCLELARHVAQAIASTAVHGDEAVGWLGLELVDERQWIVLPLGAGLPHGAGGVALFLGELAALGGGGQYADLARRALAGLPSLLNALEVREDLIAAIGPGHPHGLAGIAGAARRLAVLLDDPVLAAAARHADTLTARSAALGGADGGPPGIAARLSSSDTAFEALADHPPTADLSLGEGEFGLLEALAARSYRDRRAEAAHARRAAAVIARVDREGPVCATPGGVPTPGLWHGLAGIGLGLLRVGFRDRVPAPLVQNPHHPKEDECPQSTHPTPPKNRSKTRRASPARG